jgi:hypothetical protein
MCKISKLFLILIVTILSTSGAFCQSEQDGIYLELNILSGREHIIENRIISWDPIQSVLSEYDDKNFDSGVSFGFSGKINISKTFSINYCPGITVNNNHYTFADFGIYLRLRFNKFIFAGIGVISKFCLTQREGNINYSKPRSESFEYSLIAGYSLSKKLNLLFSMNNPMNDEYGESFSNSNMNTKRTKKYVNWVIKLGIEYYL